MGGATADGPPRDGAPAADGSAPTTATSEPRGPSGAATGPLVDWALVIWLTLLGAAAALVGMAFLPQYLGAVPLPVSALLGPVVLWWAPRAAYRLTGSMIAAVLPAATWLITAAWLSIGRNGIVPGQPYSVHNGQWRVMVLLGLGVLAGAAALSLVWGDHVRRQVDADPASAPPSVGGPGR